MEAGSGCEDDKSGGGLGTNWGPDVVASLVLHMEDNCTTGVGRAGDERGCTFCRQVAGVWLMFGVDLDNLLELERCSSAVYRVGFCFLE